MLGNRCALVAMMGVACAGPASGLAGPRAQAGDVANQAASRTTSATGSRAAALPAPVVAGATDAVLPMSLDELLASRHSVGEAAVQGGGRRLAIECDGRILVIDLVAREVVATIDGGFLPSWAPTGQALAFYSAKSGSLQLWTWTPESGSRPLTNLPSGVDADPTSRLGGLVSDALRYDWSPDGTRIAFPSRRSVLVPESDPYQPRVFNNSTPPDLTLEGVFSEPGSGRGIPQFTEGLQISSRHRKRGESFSHNVLVVDTSSQEVREIALDGFALLNPRWTADGAELLMARLNASNGTDVIARLAAQAGTQSDVVLYDLKRAQFKVLATDGQLKHQPRLSADHRLLAYISGNPWGTERHVVVRDLRTNRSLQVPDGEFILDVQWRGNSDLTIIEPRHEEKRWHFTIQRGYLRISPSQPPLDAPGPKAVSASIEGAFLVLSRADTGGEKQPILRIPVSSPTIPVNRGTAEEVRWHNKRGESRQGWILYPPGVDRKRPLPLIVDAYPGVTGSTWGSHPVEGNVAWASHGYAVFRPGPRAPHVWTAPEEQGGAGWNLTEDDVMSGVQHLIDAGIADERRMCLYGHSNGGTVVAEMISRSGRFACAVIVAPALTNWLRPTILMPGGRETYTSFSGGFSLDKNPEEYVKLSPVFRVTSATTPTLIAAGDRDGDFQLDAIELYNALRSSGTEVTLLRYPEQGHVFSGAALKDFWSRELEFFERHLKAPSEAAATIPH